MINIDQQIAQVREGLSMWLRGEPPQTAIGMGHGEVIAALSVIERHVQDMETALERIGRGVCSNVMAGFEECDRQRTFDDFCAVCRARAALPAREKGAE